MKRIVIILWAGSVVFGACSILRRSEQQRTASATLSAAETRSAFRRDSLVASAGRVVRIDRRGVVTLPHMGEVHWYRERIHVDEKEHATRSSSVHETDTSRHQVKSERYESSHAERQVAPRSFGWWLLLAGGIIAVVVFRLFRFWPFK